ncbi:MAG: hypothetical protein ACI31A_00690 [Candidatus Limisoma sp.]
MKKIFRTVARQATLLAAVMLAAFSFSLTSCSDDDDTEEPKTDEPQLEKIAWFRLADDGVTPDLEWFAYMDSPGMYTGFYMADEGDVEWAQTKTGENNIALNDLVLADKSPVSVTITKTSETTGTLLMGGITCDYELSEDGKYLTEHTPDEDITFTNLKALGLTQGKLWDFSDRTDISW